MPNIKLKEAAKNSDLELIKIISELFNLDED